MIQNVEKDDFTSYGCEAANQMGYDYVRINLEQLGNQINAILAPALTLFRSGGCNFDTRLPFSFLGFLLWIRI